MKEPNPSFPYKPVRRQASTISSMDSKLLIDSLTAHISLYHHSSSSSSTSQSLSTNSNPRSSILKWFSSLNLQQRQAHLTIVDRKFVQILLQMQSKLQSNGHGSFIVLPDILSTDGLGLPSLCYRRSHGLLARVSELNESERLVYDSIRLFNSKEGESVQECSCSANWLDSVVVSEELVENVDRFVDVMDGVSSGAFLMGDESGLGLDWVELEWLKGRGYYSMVAFAVNRLEVALRLSWLNCNSGKKRGVKLKEKTSAAGVAANIYWRKKGCIEWWDKLDAATRKDMFQVVLGKAAKSLIAEILNGTNSSVKDNSGLFSSGARSRSRFSHTMSSQDIVALGTTADSVLQIGPTAVPERPLLSFMSSLLVLKEIFSILYTCRHGEEEKQGVNFSSLASVSTISDCVFRKLRGLLMLVSLDCTKHELFEDGNSNLPSKKSKEKLGAANRKKKGVSRNTKCSKPIRNSLGDDTGLDKTCKEHHRISVHGKAQTASRKSRKKISNGVKKLPDPVEVGNTAGRTIEDLSPVISRSGAAKSDRVSDDPDNMPNAVSIGDDKLGLNPNNSIEGSTMLGNDKLGPNQNNSTEGSSVLEKVVESNEEGTVVCLRDGSRLGGLNDQQSDGMIESYFESSRSDTASSVVHPDEVPPLMSVRGHDVSPSEDIECRSRGDPIVTNLKSVICDGEIAGCKPQEVVPIRGKRSESVLSSGCPSYEWPSIAPMHIPSVNSHLPATTDRLHLDVGHNWKNHFHRSFVPPVHQVRNPPTENGCSRILARPVPMSLDWPPMVRRGCGLAPPVTLNYDSGFIPRRRSSFHQGFTSPSLQYGTTTIDDDRMYSGDFVDFSDFSNSHELSDEQDNHWISEEELEVHAVSGRDYSQYFGGGVMYWNSSDLPGSSFSRPPSLSSEDGSFGWREADMNRAVDDMVAFSSSYSTNGLTSPSAASFCSPFDPLAPGSQSVGYVIPGSDVSSKMLHPQSTIPDAVGEDNATGSLSNLRSEGEVNVGDSLPYPILRPIIIPNMSRERSRSDFKRSHDHKSPCVPRNRGEQPRIKRPPSPVVLCVPRAPRPPPPSPASDSRKHRGFPSVRSGSSSPRHWGLRGVLHDSLSFEEACVRMDGSEVVWPSWRNKAHAMIQPIPGALLQDHLIAITQLTLDQEHPDVAFPLEPPESLNCATRQASLSLMHSLLHDEIDAFCKQVSSENLIRKPYINWAVKRVARSLQVLWPRSRTNIFGSNATGLSLPTSDVDLVICLPPVRNLEPIKEAGILEGRNGIKETCLQHAARYLVNQEWVKNDSLKIVENTAIPIIMLVVEVPHELVASSASISTLKGEPTEIVGEVGDPSGTSMDNSESEHLQKHSSMKAGDSKDMKLIRLDISFKSPSHTGLQTTELVKELTEQFPAATPLALVLKQFLADRSLDQSYSGGLSSYCLVLLITRFLQHEYHHGRPINQNFGGLLMDFFYFFGNVFDPRQMRISVRGSGLYITRERGCSIDPIYIDDPLYPTNNVGRNCFRIHQCIKAFADAYSALENELTLLPSNGESSSGQGYNLLPKIIPSIGLL